MNEDVVKVVLLKHLELTGKQPRRRPRQSSGPDVLIDGTAIEVKGDKIVERALVNQLAIYLHDYTFVELAIPSQAFSFRYCTSCGRWNSSAGEGVWSERSGSTLFLR